MSDNTSPIVDLEQAESEVDFPAIGSRERYDALMQVVLNRVTVRKFDSSYDVPDEHYDLFWKPLVMDRPAPTRNRGTSSL